jgi:hypothetical protein
MALTLTTIRNSNVKSIHGRELGIDASGYLVGPPGMVQAIEDVDAATTLAAHGISRLVTSGSTSNRQHNLPTPVPGIRKTIVLTSTSTGSQQLLSTPNGAAIFSSAGTTANAANLVGPGGFVVLVGITTAVWAVESAQNTTYTTST